LRHINTLTYLLTYLLRTRAFCTKLVVGLSESNIYTSGDEVINAENEEKDLGVIVSDTLKPSGSQCIAAAQSANKTLAMNKRTFVNRDSKIILKLYQSLLRPKLEYCVQAWRPYLKDIDVLEKVQKRVTRLMTKDRSFVLSYEERLQRLGLKSLESRILRGDLMEVFKIFKGFGNIGVIVVIHINV